MWNNMPMNGNMIQNNNLILNQMMLNQNMNNQNLFNQNRNNQIILGQNMNNPMILNHNLNNPLILNQNVNNQMVMNQNMNNPIILNQNMNNPMVLNQNMNNHLQNNIMNYDKIFNNQGYKIINSENNNKGLTLINSEEQLVLDNKRKNLINCIIKFYKDNGLKNMDFHQMSQIKLLNKHLGPVFKGFKLVDRENKFSYIKDNKRLIYFINSGFKIIKTRIPYLITKSEFY